MSKLVMVRSWAHRLTDMVRKDNILYELATVHTLIEHPDLGNCYIGAFVCGMGLFHVHFPSDGVRVANQDEISKYTASEFTTPAGTFRVSSEEFATQKDLLTMPVGKYEDFGLGKKA